MNGGELLSFVASSLTSIFVTAAIFWGVPRLARTAFRAQLDMIRDDLLCDVANGRLTNHAAASRFLDRLELLHRHAYWVRLSRAFALTRALAAAGKKPESLLVDFNELPLPERRLMYEYQARIVDAGIKQLLRGSVAGWILIPMVAFARLSNETGSPARSSPLPQPRMASRRSRQPLLGSVTSKSTVDKPPNQSRAKEELRVAAGVMVGVASDPSAPESSIRAVRPRFA